MLFHRLVLYGLLFALTPVAVPAQSEENVSPNLFLELNTVQHVDGACRLTFLAQNDTGAEIDQAVFETVIFDSSGGVLSLSLFDFRELPAGRARVRQFDLPGMACESVGRVLINGANTCLVGGADSGICQDALSLESRLNVELLG